MADNGTDAATIYPGSVGGAPISQLPLVVSVNGAPTGQVFNPTNGFKLRVGDQRLPAKFIFDGEEGSINAWTLSDPVQTVARTKLQVPGAVFKGLALSFFGHHPALYAADAGNGRVWVIDAHFHVMATPGLFRDRMLPDGYKPFGIQAIGNRILVSYARFEPGEEDESHGPGLGFVDVYTRNRAAGAAADPPRPPERPLGHGAGAGRGFGRFSGALLVGNFGDGHINAYDMTTGERLGQLRRPNGHALAIEGLWGLRFGNGVTGRATDLLFSAGIDDEAHGLVGKIRHVS